jgi:fatty acid desaturase
MTKKADMNINADEDLNDEERQQAILIFKVLVWLVTILMFAAIALQIYAGFHNWVWFLAIPLWAILWFILKTAKRYLRNISDTLEAEITVQGAKPFE